MFRSSIVFLLVLFNTLPLLAVYQAVNTWVRPESRRKKVLIAAFATIILLNVPITLFWFRAAYLHLYNLPTGVLRGIFYPALAWQTTALLFTVFVGPIFVILLAANAAKRLRSNRSAAAGLPVAAAPAPVIDSPLQAPAISRRNFLTGGAGLLVPAVYCFSAYELYDMAGDVDISPEITVPIANLPRSLDGMTIVQLSDLHVGPYVRQRELQHWVGLANQLKPDLIVLTGDLIDRSMVALPDAVQGLQGLRAPLGVLATMGNHDLSSDRLGSRGDLRGGENIVKAIQTSGIRTLRNEVTYLGEGSEKLAVLGLDWMTARDLRNFYRYHPGVTRNHLTTLAQQVPEGAPSILLTHHPDTFSEVPPLGVSLTLAGHTHGGGQVVFFTWDGAPVGISSARFRYVSGLYREGASTLYVNRGLGYFGVPIRINCPPEISRFRLVRAEGQSQPMTQPAT